MRRDRWSLMAAVMALAAGVASANPSADPQATEQETVTVRGTTNHVWPFDDLRARGFEIPDVSREDNAYWVYIDAINAYTELPGDLHDAFDYAVNTAWPKGHDAGLKKFMLDPDNQKALELARKAGAYQEHQLYYFGDPGGGIISVLLPNLSEYRALGKMLIVDGRRLEAEGKIDEAMADYVAALQLGHHVSGGITLIENLVGVSVWVIGDRAISQMVLRRNLSAERLEDILDQLNDLKSEQPSTHNGMKNERVFGTSIVDELTARPFSLPQNMGSLGWGSGGDSFDVSRNSSWRELEARIGKLIIPDRTIKKHMNAYYDQLIERAGLPAYQADWENFDEEGIVTAIPQWDVLAHMLLPSLSRASILGERCRMQSQATRLAVALRIFATEGDGLAPSRLDELSAWVPADELVDPFSGKQFVYDHRENAWRFYSVSENFTDDDGKTGDNDFKLDYVVRFPPEKVEAFQAQNDATEPL
ncbi:MAG: hypothetical protein H6817_06085 [Phycisphaerales bacterium]|nr:hypothetical protein [Phycisphaerales bacterium]